MGRSTRWECDACAAEIATQPHKLPPGWIEVKVGSSEVGPTYACSKPCAVKLATSVVSDLIENAKLGDKAAVAMDFMG